MQITHTDILEMLNYASNNADMTPWNRGEHSVCSTMNHRKVMEDIATRIRGVLRAKYEPLIFRDELIGSDYSCKIYGYTDDDGVTHITDESIF